MKIYHACRTTGMRYLTPAAFLVMFLAGSVTAQEDTQGNLYRWEDEDGTVTFSSSPPPEGVDATVISIPPSQDDATTRQQMQRLDALNETAEPVQGEEQAPDPGRGQDEIEAPESDEVMQERGMPAP